MHLAREMKGEDVAAAAVSATALERLLTSPASTAVKKKTNYTKSVGISGNQSRSYGRQMLGIPRTSTLKKVATNQHSPCAVKDDPDVRFPDAPTIVKGSLRMDSGYSLEYGASGDGGAFFKPPRNEVKA
jgi:hypothetical protein